MPTPVPQVCVLDSIPGDGAVAEPEVEAKVKHHRPEGFLYIVDDDDGVCDSLGVLLEAYGFVVRTYTSSVAYLADERRRGETRCLIIDQDMPGLTGLDIVAELRRQNLVFPTVLITGRLDPAIAQRAAQLAVSAILEKPFPAGRLVEVIERAARSH